MDTLQEEAHKEQEADKEYERICIQLMSILRSKMSKEAKHKAILILTGWK